MRNQGANHIRHCVLKENPALKNVGGCFVSHPTGGGSEVYEGLFSTPKYKLDPDI